MHVALCTDGVFPLAVGGMQRHSRLLAEHLARSGRVRLTVLHPHPVPQFDPALGIHEVHVPPIRTDKLYLKELWHYSGRMAERLDLLRPDVVLSQGFAVWRHIGRYSSRLVVNPHGLEMFQGISLKERALGLPFRMVLRHIVRHSARVVSLGGRLTTILQGLVQGSKCRVAVVPNAVDVPNEPVAYPALGGPLRLLFVGRFAFNKGLDVLMKVARRLEGHKGLEHVRFELAGDGPLLEEYKAEGLPANVGLLGRVDDGTLFRLYEECHALVLPTRFEGMPTVVLEAMARARPVLVSDVGATAELVGPPNGFLLPKGDDEALYQAVSSLAEMDATALARMGAASYALVSERFSWPSVTRTTIDLLYQVYDAAGPSPRDRSAIP